MPDLRRSYFGEFELKVSWEKPEGTYIYCNSGQRLCISVDADSNCKFYSGRCENMVYYTPGTGQKYGSHNTKSVLSLLQWCRENAAPLLGRR